MRSIIPAMTREIRAILVTTAMAALVVIGGRSSSAAVMLTVPATANTPPIGVYIARPQGTGPFPAILFLHGCAGFNGLIAVAADKLAARGYIGVAIDSLGPHGMQTACDGDNDGGQADAARATLAWLRTQPYVIRDRLGVVGFSMGADAALTLIDTHGSAAPAGLRVAVAYYPSCEDRDGLVNIPLAIFDGDADKVSPAAPCTAMVHAGTAAGKSITITTYPGATHGFDVPGPDHTFFGEPIHYDPTASADAALQTYHLIVRYLGQ
jgi:dienelactone hydrolase